MYEYTCYTDGASRGNPGHASVGIVIKNNKTFKTLYLYKYLGDKLTCNYAEYTAFIMCIEKLLSLKAKTVEFFVDSALVANQINGKYRVSSPNIKPLYKKAISLLSKFDSYTITHTYREGNTIADKLANKALDEQNLR